MLNHKRNALSIALAVVLTPTLAAAQSAATSTDTTVSELQTKAEEAANPAADSEIKQLDSVNVTGIRASIERAIDTKQSEDTIVEAISAEDIGKLPDSSIADSIARLPGITAQRYGGRPQELNIRGMAGDFSTALLNGREQVSFGNNRGVEFDQYPSELISQVVVNKTTSADLVGQGLSGTVNLKTVRPLDFDGPVTAIGMRGEMNELDGEKAYGNRYSFSHINQNDAGTLGIAFGFAHMDSPTQTKQYESWGYNNGVLGGGNAYLSDIDNTRNGFMATVQFKPNDEFSSTLDMFYSKFKREETKRGLQYGLAWGSGSTLTDADYSASGTTVNSTWTNVDPVVVRNDYNEYDDTLFSLGWRNELALNDYWKLSTDVSYSRAHRKEMVLETYAGLCDGGTDTLTASNNSEGWVDVTTGYDYGDTSNLCLLDPNNWGGDRNQAGYLKYFDVRDTISAIRLDLERSFDTGFITSVQFGANLSERTKSRASTEYTLCLTEDCLVDAEAEIPSQYVGSSDFGFAGIGSVTSLDVLSMLNDGYYYLVSKDHTDIRNKNWEVHEQIGTLYAQANIDASLGPVVLKGNLGIQGMRTNQESTGITTFEGAGLSEANTDGAIYTDWLPSMNLSFGFAHEQFLRFGAARQTARPRMDDLKASADYSWDETERQWEGSGGNAKLKPWLAHAYDLSYEKYFGDGRAYVAAAYFYKDLLSYIYNQTVEYDFSQLPIDESTLTEEMTANWIGEYTQPVNGEGGVIKGYELTASAPLDLLWAPLEGFGLIATYSETKSEIHPDGPDSTSPLPGLSKYVSNITLYYERYGFSARISQRTRSKYLGEVEGAGGDRTEILFEGESIMDLQLGYTFQKGQFKDLSLTLQVNNVGNEPSRSIYDIEEQPKNYYEYGRTILLGLNYRF